MATLAPEDGLVLTGSISAGQISATEYTSRTVDIVHAGEVILPSTFASAACLWEHGGAGTGSWLGVIQDPDNGNAWSLRFRSGDGADTVQFSNNSTIVINVPISEIPEFDGGSHTVAFDIKPSAPARLRLWIDGREVMLGYTTAGGALEGTSWSGGDVGGWGTGSTSIAGVINYNGSNAYQTDAPWPAATQSDLRYYLGQLAGNIAKYGSATYGVASYGVIPVVAPVVGVQASGTADTDINITADAQHTLISVSAAFAQGGVGVAAAATEVLTGADSLEATASVNDITVKTVYRYDITGAGAVASVGNVSTTADSNYLSPSVSATSSAGSTVVTADSVHTSASVIATASVNDVVTTAASVLTTSSVSATSSIDDVVVVAEANTTLASVSATGTTGSVVITADSNYVVNSVSASGVINGTLTFILGTGVDVPVTQEAAVGESNTVADIFADNVYTPNGVQASGTADTDIIIEADSNHTLTSVQGVSATGGVGEVTAAATTFLIGEAATGIANDDLYFIGEANVTPEQAVGVGEVTVPEIIADSYYTTTGVPLTLLDCGDVTVAASAEVPVTGSEGASILGTAFVVTASAVLLPTIKALSIPKPYVTIYTTVYVYDPEQYDHDERLVYVPALQTKDQRTAVVGTPESRTVIAPVETSTRTSQIAA